MYQVHVLQGVKGAIMANNLILIEYAPLWPLLSLLLSPNKNIVLVKNDCC